MLLTRLSAIGDCILTIPLACEIKKLWPECRLTWAVSCSAAQLLESHPAVDEVLSIDKRWLRKPVEWGELRSALRARKIDLAVDPQGLSKSALLGWLSGARQRVGLDYSHGREIAPLLATKRVHRTTRHMVDTYRELLKPWTQITEGGGTFDMPAYPDAANRAEEILHQTNLNSNSGGWVALNPGAGWSTRIWPVQRFGMLAREIYQSFGRKSLVFWAGDTELLMAKVIEEESRGAAIAAPQTNLQELVELIRRSSLLVTGDTGPLHMASAVGTPTVSLHGVTWADESGPYGNQHVAIQSPYLPQGKKLVRRGPNTAMQAIEVDEVLRGCGSLLVNSRSSLRAIA